MPLSGWCAAPAGARTKCFACRWVLCECACHSRPQTTDKKGAA